MLVHCMNLRIYRRCKLTVSVDSCHCPWTSRRHAKSPTCQLATKNVNLPTTTVNSQSEWQTFTVKNSWTKLHCRRLKQSASWLVGESTWWRLGILATRPATIEATSSELTLRLFAVQWRSLRVLLPGPIVHRKSVYWPHRHHCSVHWARCGLLLRLSQVARSVCREHNVLCNKL